MAEFMKLQAPQPPGPGAADLASFAALQRYEERMNGFHFPEAELRAEREANADGSVGKDRDLPGGALLMKWIQQPQAYTKIPAPALFLFVNPHSLGRWVDGSSDPKIRKDAQSYSASLSALVEKQIEAVKQGLPGKRVVTIAGANHFVYLSNEAEALKQMRSFLSFLSGLPQNASPR